MIDVVADGIRAFNAELLLGAGFMMLGIGGLFAFWWAGWYFRAWRARGRIVAVISTGTRRSDAEWEAQYKTDNAATAQKLPLRERLRADFSKAPGHTTLAVVFFAVLSLIPFVFFGVGVSMIHDYYDIKNSGVAATATVTGYSESYDSDTGYTYAPVLSFRDAEGTTHERQDRISTSSKKYEVGSAVAIIYDPENPDRFIIDSFWRYMGLGLGFAVVGGAVIIAGYWFGIRRPDASPAARRRRIESIKRQHYMNQHYTPVYEVTAPGGQSVRVPDRGGSSNWLAGILPGTEVRLWVLPGKAGGPPRVKRQSMAALWIGIFFAATGAVLVWQAMKILGGGGTFGTLLALFMIAATVLYKMRGIFMQIGRDGLDMGSLRQALAGISAETAPAQGYELTAEEIRERIALIDRNNMMVLPLIVLFGLGLLFAGQHMYGEMSALAQTGMRTQGEVAELVRRSDGEGGPVYYPRVRFSTADGREVLFTGNVGSNPPSHRTGDRVNVLYAPENPQKAAIDRGMLNWLMPLALAGAGVALLAIAAAMAGGIRKRRGRR